MISWFVYMVRCADNSFYTGVTTCIERRITEHNTSNKGARYTRARRPVELVYSEVADDKSQAFKREYAIKQLTRIEKSDLIK